MGGEDPAKNRRSGTMAADDEDRSVNPYNIQTRTKREALDLHKRTFEATWQPCAQIEGTDIPCEIAPDSARREYGTKYPHSIWAPRRQGGLS